MKKKFFLIMLIFVSILCLGNFCLGFLTIVFKGFVDFPCFVTYDEKRQCVNIGVSGPAETGEERIQVFLSTYYLGFSGGGCHYEHTASESVEMDTPAGQLTFKRNGDTLLVNGQELAIGENFSHVNYWNANPWTEYYVEFTNYGVVKICDSDMPSRLIIDGEYGNRISLLKVRPLILLLLSAVVTSAVLLAREVRRGKKA